MTNANHRAEALDRRDDPRLTAYVLGELASEERVALERELALDPELAAEMRAIESLAGELRGAFAATPSPVLDCVRRDTILAAAQPAPIDLRTQARRLRRLAVAAGLIALAGAGLWSSVRVVTNRERLSGHGYSGSGAGVSISDKVAHLFSDESPSPETSAATPAESLELMTGLGYRGDGDETPSVSERKALRGLGYGGVQPASRPNASSIAESAPAPVGETETFTGGSMVRFPIAGDQPAQTYAWRSIREEPQLGWYERYVGPGTEAYDRIPAAGFLDPTRDPLSTFSIDVDTASYANVRRFLNGRQLPPSDAVRIEELVNYFRYNYPEPSGPVPFSVTVDAASAPWQPEHRLVRIGLRGRASADERPKVKNLVFLVDVSGSMDSPDKLPLVQRSLHLLVSELSPEDRVALVVYAGNSGVVLPSTAVDARATILAAIDGLTAGGSTNGGSGIQLAYQAAREHFAKDGVNRVILATDGDFNVGITDRAELLRLIEEERRSGVFLSVLGFGTGNLKDGTMEQLADHGNGNYGYVDSLAEARKLLVREMDATLETIAKDVKIQVEFNPAKVASWRLVGYENRVLAARDFNDDQKDAGEIGAGHTVTALYEIAPVGGALTNVDPLRYQPSPTPGEWTRTLASAELLTVKLRYKQPNSDTSELLTVPFTDDGRVFAAAAPELRFAAAVAAFGLCLRNSDARGATTFADVRAWAEPALGADPHGDRREFLRLVDLAAGLSGR